MSSGLNDPTRLEAIERSGLLARPEQERFDVLCESAATLLNAPVAMLNILTSDTQHSVGVYPTNLPRKMKVRDTGCQHVIMADAPVIIPNTLLHPVMCMSPIVTLAGVMAYVGVPVYYDDEPIGSFCLADYVVREWKPWDVIGLQGLARLAGLAVDRGD